MSALRVGWFPLISRLFRVAGDRRKSGNTCLRVPLDALHPASWPADESGAVAVAALIVLAGCLPGDAKLGGDLRPSDPEADGVLDQCR